MSMSIHELVSFYRTVLESLGYLVRGNRVILLSDEGEEPVMVDGKQLVLPDDSFLRSPKWEVEIPFHPLCENPQRGESEVVRTLLSTTVANLNISLLGVVIHLYSKVVMAPDTKVLNTEQAAVLPFVTASSDKVKKAFINLLEHVTMEDESKSLINCNLRRRCPLNGTKYERVCVVRFPFADMTRQMKPFGLSSAAEFDSFRGMLDFVLPGWEVDDTFSVGTNSFAAPYFTSVMLMYATVGRRLNEVIDLYTSIDPDLENYRLPGVDTIIEAIEKPGNMEAMRDVIPALEGNKGTVELSPQNRTGYQIEQPKKAVDVPWEEQASPHVQPRKSESAEPVDATPYVPGCLNPQGAQPQQVLPGIINQGHQNYDPDSFHGRMMAKQALMQPLGTQNNIGRVGQSPFIDNGDKKTNRDGVYRPGTTQVGALHARPINNSGLGF